MKKFGNLFQFKIMIIIKQALLEELKIQMEECVTINYVEQRNVI